MSKKIKKYIFITLFVFIFIISLVFSQKNNQIIMLDYLFASSDIQLPVLLFIFLILGACLTLVACLPKVLTLQHKVSGLKKQLSVLKTKMQAQEGYE